MLALYTGCRRGELCALKWHDFIMTDKYRCVLTVSRSRSHIPGQDVMEGPTKNGHSRTIVIEEDITSFTKHLRKIFRENDFPESFHLHTLRHYVILSLLHPGVDKQTVAEIAGHADTSFLERTYCHPQMELKKQAANVMTDVLLHSA